MHLTVACTTDVTKLLAAVVYKVNSTISFIICICWIVIYPVDSTIQHLNNQGLVRLRCTSAMQATNCGAQWKLTISGSQSQNPCPLATNSG